MSFRLRMLGMPELVGPDGETPPGLGPGKPLAVLCYLAREGESRRDAVAAMLWGDTDEDRARNAFRQALHRLRGALGEDVIGADRERLGVQGDAGLWTDVEAFEEALDEGDHEAALGLWRGDFLEGFDVGEPPFQHWVDGQRARLRARYQDALATAVRDALERGQTDAAVERAGRLTALAPLEAPAALLEARALAAAGRVTEAAAALRSFVARYTEELDIEAPREVEEALARFDAADAGRRQPRGSEQDHAVGTGEHAGFVREPELAQLLEAWRDVLDGDGRTVLVEGEAGAGKTRLVNEFLRRLEALDAVIVLRGAERVAGRGLPYESLGEALRGLLGARGLAGASEHLLAEAARLLPDLRDRFDLPTPPDVEDAAGRLRFFEGVAAVLDAVAYEQPLCVILERFHNADAATRDLTFFLSNRLRGSGVLFVVTFRPTADASTGAARYGADAGEMDPVAVLRLERLTEDQIRTVLAAAPEGKDLAPDDIGRVARLADGNPFHALTLARGLIAGSDLRRAPVPLRDLVRSRLDTASPDERRTLVALALIGRPISLRLLAACTHLPEQAALDAFHALLALGLVTESHDGRVNAREAAAEAALERGQAGASLIAGWTAEALKGSGAASPGELAGLYRRAGRDAEAYAQALDGARQAAAVGAFDTAAELLELALSTAPAAAQRAEAATRLAALGQGPARLAAPDGATLETVPEKPGPPTRTGWWRRPVATGVILIVLTLAVFAALPVMRGSGPVAIAGRALRDTLVLTRVEPDGREALLGVTGDLGETMPQVELARTPLPAWLDSLARRGSALLAPEGRLAAIPDPSGATDAPVVVSVNDGAVLRRLGGDGDRVLDWAPDASAALVARGRRLADGSYDTDLWIEAVSRRESPVPVDTSANRSVVSAAWAPNGVRVAWGARDRDTGQQDIWVALADGSEAWNASADPGEDREPAWAPDGRRVAFTSERTGSSDIYAVEVETRRLWRLTWDPALDDRASFAPGGDFVAFESTRDGDAAVYVMASYGGEPRRVSTLGQRVRLAGWRGAPVPYLSFLHLDLPATEPGDTAVLVVEPTYSDYVARNRGTVRWHNLDPDRVRVLGLTRPGPFGGAMPVTVVGLRPGLARVAVNAGGWRADTAILKVGSGVVVVLSDTFSLQRNGAPVGPAWEQLGPSQMRTDEERPRTQDSAPPGVTWSRASFPLVYGASITVQARGPFGAGPRREGRLRVGLIQPRSAVGSDVPPSSYVASMVWDGETDRFEYTVGLETWSEQALEARSETAAALTVRLIVNREGRVVFFVDGRERWRSTVGITGGASGAHRTRLAIEDRAPDDLVRVDEVEVVVGGDRAAP